MANSLLSLPIEVILPVYVLIKYRENINGLTLDMSLLFVFCCHVKSEFTWVSCESQIKFI